MKELIEALTRAANAFAVYYEKAGNPMTAVPAAEATEPKVARTRKPKEDKIETAPVIEPVVELTDAESAVEVLAVTRAYVSRFQKSTPDGQARAIAILNGEFKKPGIKALVHAERVAFMAKLKSEIAAADAN